MASTTTVSTAREAVATPASPTTRELERITHALRGLRFGSVHVVVQDGAIVQIERTEKFRMPRPSEPTG